VSALELARELGHQALHFVQDRESGLRAVVAIHDTTLGPATGGTRMRPYPTLDDAAVDALRLSRGMTYKAALAGLRCGGGKGVIVADPGRDKSEALLEAYARLVESFGGRFYTGCDMGITVEDLTFMRRFTAHLGHTGAEGGLDTSDLAALGTFAAMAATAERLRLSLDGLRVAVQGVGQVGSRLCRLLHEQGARLTVTDVDPEAVRRVVEELGAETASVGAIYDVEADVFSPNAAGGILSPATLPRLRVRAVVGAANNQLATPEDGDALHARGIVYAPDFVVNAGGLISILWERGEADRKEVVARTQAIGETVGLVLDRARREETPPHRVADRMAEERLAAARLG